MKTKHPKSSVRYNETPHRGAFIIALVTLRGTCLREKRAAVECRRKNDKLCKHLLEFRKAFARRKCSQKEKC